MPFVNDAVVFIVHVKSGFLILVFALWERSEEPGRGEPGALATSAATLILLPCTTFFPRCTLLFGLPLAAQGSLDPNTYWDAQRVWRIGGSYMIGRFADKYVADTIPLDGTPSARSFPR
jgi:hypothetical protein